MAAVAVAAAAAAAAVAVALALALAVPVAVVVVGVVVVVFLLLLLLLLLVVVVVVVVVVLGLVLELVFGVGLSVCWFPCCLLLILMVCCGSCVVGVGCCCFCCCCRCCCCCWWWCLRIHGDDGGDGSSSAAAATGDAGAHGNGQKTLLPRCWSEMRGVPISVFGSAGGCLVSKTEKRLHSGVDDGPAGDGDDHDCHDALARHVLAWSLLLRLVVTRTRNFLVERCLVEEPNASILRLAAKPSGQRIPQAFDT